VNDSNEVVNGILSFCSWCGQILDGLNYLHTHSPPMWHRALRCETVFISGNVSVVKIGALETAQLLEHFAPAELHVAPEFDAPELTTESAPAPDKVDVYAFGMTVLQMFTYDYPYSEVCACCAAKRKP
jgi:WNK lysine deficient protein kinase